MRRWVALALGLAVAMSLAATPAQAERYRYRSGTAQAFWYSEEPTGAQTYRLTVWYVGVFVDVFEGGQHFYSDLYQEVADCRKREGGETCRTVSFKVGFSDLTGQGEVFRLDSQDLTGAHLEATYRLRTYDEQGNLVGDGERFAVVTDWEGVGEVRKSVERYSYRSDCFREESVTRGRSRATEATGSLNAAALGETYDSFIGLNVSRVRQRFCEEPPA